MSGIFATVQEGVDALYEPMQTWAEENGFPVKYDAVKNPAIADGRPAERYLDVSVRFFDMDDVTLRDVGQRVRNTGTLTMLLHTPVDSNAGVPYALAESLRNKYKRPNPPCGVWFRNARFDYLGDDGAFSIVSVKADFLFDQLI